MVEYTSRTRKKQCKTFYETGVCNLGAGCPQLHEPATHNSNQDDRAMNNEELKQGMTLRKRNAKQQQKEQEKETKMQMSALNSNQSVEEETKDHHRGKKKASNQSQQPVPSAVSNDEARPYETIET